MNILKYTIKDSKYFVRLVTYFMIDMNDFIVNFDVVNLFSSVLKQLTLDFVKEGLEGDGSLANRTN